MQKSIGVRETLAKAVLRVGWAGFLLGVLWPAQALATEDGGARTSDEIIVTASPIPGGSDRFATIISHIGRGDLVRNGGANLADALKTVPGVAGTGFAAGASRPIIRGMDANRVMLLEDGINSADVSEVGPDHGVPLDPLSARDVEVVRGAATLRYGGQAIGGVVNVINNRVPLTLPEKTLSGEATASYGSNAATSEGSLLLDARAGSFAFHLDGFGRRASDYGLPEGAQANSFFRGGGYSAGSSYFFGDGDKNRTGFGVTHYDARYGIPSDTTYIDMRQTKAMNNSSFTLNAGPLQALNVNAGYADYSHNEKDPDRTIHSTFRNREWDGRAEALFGEIGPLSASALGVQIGHKGFSAGGEGGDFLYPTTTHSGAVFAFTEMPLGKRVHLQAAARAERLRIEGTSASDIPTRRSFTPVSASLGMLWDVAPSVKLGLTASTARRAPGQAELFARGPHEGSGTYETGDAHLHTERANSLEATLRIERDRFQFEGAIWGADFSDYIFGALTGRTCEEDGACFADDAHELKELNYRQRGARFWGAEAQATFEVAAFSSGAVQVSALADLVRAKFTDGGGYVPRIQPYRLGGGMGWSGGGVDANFLLLYVGTQKRVPAGDSATDSYISLDARAAWRPFKDNGGFELALIGHNLTDETQRNAASINRDAVQLPGRDVRLVLRQSF